MKTAFYRNSTFTDKTVLDDSSILSWLKKQNYQKEYGEQEYFMYYDIDIPKIINDAIINFLPAIINSVSQPSQIEKKDNIKNK